MNVSLTPELERLVNEKVKTGRYQTASEVIREALRLLEDHDSQRALRADIQAGIDDLRRGNFTTYTPGSGKLLRDITARGRRRLFRTKTPPKTSTR